MAILRGYLMSVKRKSWLGRPIRPERLAERASALGAIVAAIALIASIVSFSGAKLSLGDARAGARIAATVAELQMKADKVADALDRKLDNLDRELLRTKSEVARLSASTSAGSKPGDPRQISELRQIVEKTDTSVSSLEKDSRILTDRLEKLEAVILEDPLKALEMPLLRRELDGIRQQWVRDVDGLKAENARVYDLMKWLIGLMALVSLSLVGTAVGNVFRREGSNARQDSQRDSAGREAAAGSSGDPTSALVKPSAEKSGG